MIRVYVLDIMFTACTQGRVYVRGYTYECPQYLCVNVHEYV